jgi:hypothetical protein
LEMMYTNNMKYESKFKEMAFANWCFTFPGRSIIGLKTWAK